MTDRIDNKLEKLKACLNRYDSVVVALSGGVDSALLVRVASEVMPHRITALTFRSIFNPPGEIESAIHIAGNLPVDHRIIDFHPLEIEAVASNSPERCYHCKKALAAGLLRLAAELNVEAVLEGSNVDDMKAHRPGARAVLEAGLVSPLKEAGLTKADVRQLARHLGLPNWDRPAGGCLATRLPYDTAIKQETMRKIFEIERGLLERGIVGARARVHGDLLRLELPADRLDVLGDRDFRSWFLEFCTNQGFQHVTVDLAGYRSGVFDRR